MNDSRRKAIITRTNRLSKAFQEEFGRLPTVEELGELYSAEMRAIAAKSSRNKVGTGGFADRDLARRAGAIGGKNKKGWRKSSEDKTK